MNSWEDQIDKSKCGDKRERPLKRQALSPTNLIWKEVFSLQVIIVALLNFINLNLIQAFSTQNIGTNPTTVRVEKSNFLHRFEQNQGVTSRTRRQDCRWNQSRVVLRGQKNEVNDLLRGIGLTPVADTVKIDSVLEENPKSKKKKSISKQKSTQNQQQRQSKVKSEQSSTFQIKQRDDFRKDLSYTPTIPLQTQLDYARNGHTVLRSFLPPNLLVNRVQPLLYDHHNSAQNSLFAWQQKVQVASSLPTHEVTKKCPTIASCRSELKKLLRTPDLEIPFLQHFNTWRTHPLIEELVTSPLLVHSAATLLGIPSVRLYQDALFVKNLSRDGPTPWHSDARMAPFDTNHFITFWIPLHHIPKNKGTGLRFVDKSHIDFALPFWNEEDSAEYERLEERYSYSEFEFGDDCIKDHMPLSVGDVTVHAGWTLHCANAGDKQDKGMANEGERYALAVTFVDAKAEVREEYFEEGGSGNLTKRLGDPEDQLSFRDWIKDVKPRQKLNHPLIPIVWPRS